jgi:predicted DNA-binding transcriptional regulator AlpA
MQKLHITQYAKMLGLSRTWIYDLRKRLPFPAPKETHGPIKLYTKAQLDSWYEKAMKVKNSV